ncbi:MAG: hypothetical protein WD942_08740 [Dehalococcoidia bacterium]
MLFYLDHENRTDIDPVQATTLQQLNWTELDLENLIARHIDRVIREDELLVVGQERRYQEEPDIMAFDRDGCLHIFELKRWTSSRENLLQVLRYGQRFGQYDYQALDQVFKSYKRRIGGDGSEDLQGAHQRYFELAEPLPRSSFNGDQQFVVITDGLDRGTRDAIDYWSGRGLPVRALPYRIFLTRGSVPILDVQPYSARGLDVVDIQEGLVVVNTNSTYMPDVFTDMLEQEKAAAYFGRKSAVDGITKGSPLALYHTGVGIIAFGYTTSDSIGRAAVEGHPDEEHFVSCKFETKVNPVREPHLAVSAREINAHLDGSHRFRQTVYTLPNEAIAFVRKRLSDNRSRASSGGSVVNQENQAVP